MSFPALAAIKAVHKFMAQGRTEALANDLNSLIAMLYSNLRDLRDQYGTSNFIQDLVQIPSDCPKSPIISLLTPDPRGLAQYCQKNGYVVRAIVAPTVPEGFERVRLCLHSGNSRIHLEGFVQVLQRWVEEKKEKRQEMPEIPRARL
jgi:8-amino-7-oxononanoate synthase